MTTKTYEQALIVAKQELETSIAELGEAQTRAQELEERIADLRQTISVLSKLCGQEDMDVEESLGLTDAIRLAFEKIGRGNVTPQEMRLRLETQGFNTRRYGNLLASIHTVFKRLEAKGEIKVAGMRGDGKAAYTSANKFFLNIPDMSETAVEMLSEAFSTITPPATMTPPPHVPKAPTPAQMTPPPGLKKPR
jgi:hypothetical protein